MTRTRTLRISAVLGTTALVALLSLGTAPAHAVDAPWTPPVEVSDAYGDASATVVAPDGTITIVTESGADIVAVSSTDGGLTWGAPVNLGSGGDYAFRAAVGVTSSGALAAAWVEEVANVRSIFITFSTDRGATWTAPEALPTVNDYVDDPVIASTSATGFTVVWNEEFAKLSTSTDNGGTTWSPVQIVTENMNSYGSASLAPAGGGELVAVFQEFDGMAGRFSIQSRVSTDGGATWEPKALVGSDWSGGFGNGIYNYAVSPADDTVVAVWGRGTAEGDAIFAATSTDGGATWGPQFTVGSAADFLRFFTVSATSPTSVGVAWQAHTIASATLNFATVTVGATSATQPVVIATSTDNSFDLLPSFASAGHMLVASWWDYTASDATAGMRASVSCDAGATWAAPTVLAAGDDVADTGSKVVLSGDTFSAYWSQYTDGPSEQSLFASTLSSECSAVNPSGPTLAATGAPIVPIGAVALAILGLGGGMLALRRRAAA